ncbi:MAG TPA: PIG-L family deacetylase [Candidatus Nanoarchaeia archaeon]|nr:PIG-L family deacetylase [Candidatus Nanoarchaeia archaeon]
MQKLQLHNSTADTYIPVSIGVPVTLESVTHMGVGAHQDDLEIMAYPGILACYRRPDLWFAGVTVTNGSGSPRAGMYTQFTDEQMMVVRRKEQRIASEVGEYSHMIQLDYPSSVVKNPSDTLVAEDLAELFHLMQPDAVYTHNPADKHETHIGVFVNVVQALRSLPETERPQRLYGSQVWRDLDWMDDKDKVRLNTSGHPNLAAALFGVFDSQIEGGKRYDLATTGRWAACATYDESHGVDTTTSQTFAMDLTPLITEPTRDIADFVSTFVAKMGVSVSAALQKRITKG